jgi:lipopolysaccharide/colanic/teichoic acid biosynthesis glycosyltransferase
MMLVGWDKLPDEMRIDAVRPYYDALNKKRVSLFFKRAFDISVSLVLLVLLSPVFLVLSVAIKLDSKGPVFFRQTRVTQYGRRFKIFKFRTMVQNADKTGAQITVNKDTRITRVGRLIRRVRLDEIPQLIDVLRGTMTLVGTRPEVERYVEGYTPEMLATLLLPAGVTSEASICYKDEDKLLEGVADVDSVYLNEVLPKKMYYNLRSILEFGFWRDIKIIIRTVFAVLGKKYDK